MDQVTKKNVVKEFQKNIISSSTSEPTRFAGVTSTSYFADNVKFMLNNEQIM